MDDGDSPAGHSKNCAVGKVARALYNGFFVFGPLAFADRERDKNLLSLVVPFDGWLHLGFVEPVRFKQALHRLARFGEVLVFERRPQSERRSAEQLTSIGGDRYLATDCGSSHKPSRLRYKAQ